MQEQEGMTLRPNGFRALDGWKSFLPFVMT